MSKTFDMVDHGYLFDLFSGTLNSAFKSNGGAPFFPLQWQMVCGRLECCPLSCLLYTATVKSWHRLSLERSVGCLCYADDLALRAPSAHAFKRMLKICYDLLPKGIGVQCQRDSIDTCFCQHKTIVVDDSIEFCGQKLCFSDTWATFCHAIYLIQLILKTKLKNIFGVPTVSS